MLNELFGINDEEKIEDMISFSKNLEKIENIILDAINDKKY